MLVTNGYHIALFIHFLALVAASAAAAIVHFADGRSSRAATADEALQWHDLVDAAAKVFPVAVLTLFATGGFMMYEAGWMWSSGWIGAGALGADTLAVVGRILGVRGAVRRREIVRAREESRPVPAGHALDEALAWGNTGMAIAIVLVMVTKPALPAALLWLVVGLAAGNGVGLRFSRRAHAPARNART